MRAFSSLCLILFSLAYSSGASFTATLDRETVTLGETATLSLTFSGGQPKAIPAPPSIPGLQIGYIGQSSQVTIDNGQYSATVTHSYTVVPSQAGEFQIPALNAEVGNQRFSTQPLRFKVLQPNAVDPQSAKAGTELGILRLQLPKQAVYSGETILAELQLLLHPSVQSVQGFQLTSLPADGFNVGKMVEGGRSQLLLGTTRYTLIPLAIPLKAIKTGTFGIGPVTASLVVQIPNRTRSRDPFFEGFGLLGGEQRQVILATEEQKIQAIPLPSENVPNGFNGAIGRFTMRVSVGPTNVAVGDPITVRVELSGRGALDTLELPSQPAWRDFKAYPATSKVELTDKFGLQGTKTFEQIVAPEKTAITQLPGIEFSFFDPDAKRYQVLTHPDVPLVVRPGGLTAMPTIAAPKLGREEGPVGNDIVHIKPRLGNIAQIGAPLMFKPWFLALQSLPFLALFVSIGCRKRREGLANNPRLRRQREVAQVVKEGLTQLRRLASAQSSSALVGINVSAPGPGGNNSDEFFAMLFRLLQEQIGERLNVPASAITESVVEEQLRPHGLKEPLLNSLQDLFHRCNIARYAPVTSSQELAELVPTIEGVLHQLQQTKL